MSIKRALYCVSVMPEHDRESGSKTIFDFIVFLREAGWEVTLIAMNAPDAGRAGQALGQLGVASYAGMDSLLLGDAHLAGAERLIAAGQFDLAILSFWHVAEYYLPAIRRLSPKTRAIVDSMDLHFLRTARSILRSAPGMRCANRLGSEYAAEMVRELNVYAAADVVLARSRKEADLINDFVGDPDLAFVAGDYEAFDASAVRFADRRGILFVGNFWHPPNVEAAKYLLTEIIPLLDPAVLREHQLYLVGNGLTDEIVGYAAGIAGVRTVGWVPSILPYLQRARTSVVPLLHGAGTKRKLIQALMTGTPSVSTPVGIEGLDLKHGEHVLVANDPASFAEAVVRLLGDEELWQHLALQGRLHVAAHHSREAIRSQFMEAVTNALAREPKRWPESVGNENIRP